jgi:hypothetical protein
MMPMAQAIDATLPLLSLQASDRCGANRTALKQRSQRTGT